VRNFIPLIFVALSLVTVCSAQSPVIQPAAEQTIQPAQSSPITSGPALGATAATRTQRELKIPAGTLIEVEVAYTVNSLDVKAGERISFRVLIPIVIDGATVIERDALVTARITRAKRGGHWGKAGKLVWSMEDVEGVDATRIPLAPETAARGDKLWSLEPGATMNTLSQGKVTGTSHSGEVATMSIISGAFFPPIALLGGFKRGENAILREGRRYVVAVGRDTSVKVVGP
jgi:hypothetical protein